VLPAISISEMRTLVEEKGGIYSEDRQERKGMITDRRVRWK
jgi:hypothetical protein